VTAELKKVVRLTSDLPTAGEKLGTNGTAAIMGVFVIVENQCDLAIDGAGISHRILKANGVGAIEHLRDPSPGDAECLREIGMREFSLFEFVVDLRHEVEGNTMGEVIGIPFRPMNVRLGYL